MTGLPPYDSSHAHTAHHEAGHAVMACYLDIAFDGVTIIPDGWTNGLTFGLGHPDNEVFRSEDDRRTSYLEYLMKMAKCTVSG